MGNAIKGNSIWSRVDLASGEVGECWQRAIGLGWQWLPVGWPDQEAGRKSVGSEQRRRTIPVPVEMEKEPYGNGDEGGECYRGNEKIIIFYNMKWPVVGRFWFGGSADLLSDREIFFHVNMRRMIGHHGECCQRDDMKTWFAKDQVWLESEIPWHGNRSRRYELGWHRTEMKVREVNAIG